jgi:carbon-monoxide dehydrogenase large subunit
MPEFSSTKADLDTSQGGHPNVHYTVGAAAIKMRIDKQTGQMKILKIVEAVDCGKALNPELVRGQIIGGLIQGVSTVLYEDMRFDHRGKMLNPNFTDYKIPTALDIPDEIVPIIIEVAQPDGPFGARGVGEHPMIPAAPMIANAIEDALGIRITSMPITAEKVCMTYLEKNK